MDDRIKEEAEAMRIYGYQKKRRKTTWKDIKAKADKKKSKKKVKGEFVEKLT